jgi:putative ABC transport system permease protein
MNTRRIFRELRLGVKTLWLHKLRSALTVLGVVFGVASVIAMLAIGEGASQEALERIKSLGSNNIIVRAQKPTKEAGNGQQSYVLMYGLLYEDARVIADAFPQAAHVVPAKIVRKEARLGNRNLELRVVGTTPQWFEVVQREMISGRPISSNDSTEHRNVVVLTEHGARKILASEGSLGSQLRIASDVFTIVGVIKSTSGDGGGVPMPDQDIDAYIPLDVARTRFGDFFYKNSAGSREREKVQLHQLIVQAKNPEDVMSMAAGIERLFNNRHPKGDYVVSVPLALLRQAEATKRTFSIVLGSIAGISLLVGGIGIMNIMLASVTERTREIGIRRAIGAKRIHIIRQFLIETMVLSLSGGLCGLLLGVTIPAIITATSGMPTVVTASSVILALVISAGVGIVFGLYPAIRAARLSPIEALRHE